MELKASGLSDVGLSRSHNEDAMNIDLERRLFLVADGMGGHGHGDVASRLAVEAIRFQMEQSFLAWEEADSIAPPAQRSYTAALESAVKAAHQRVVGAVVEDQTLVGMGTTVVGLVVGNGAAVVAHVGDSRAYRLRDGQLELVTDDHTWVNEQVKAGYLSSDQARTHPLKSVVTRAVGGDHEVEVDVRELELQPGDLFLLCSDGLTTMLRDDEIREQLTASDSLEERCRQLVATANDHGGVDNITVVLLEVTAGDQD